jgi:hypothetical protein
MRTRTRVRSPMESRLAAARPQRDLTLGKAPLRASPSLATLAISGPADSSARREPEKPIILELLPQREFTAGGGGGGS